MGYFKKFLFIVCAVLLFAKVALSQEKTIKKVIYKWESEGIIHYSHIRPSNVDDYVRLDSQGREVEEFSEDFDEIVEITARPDLEAESEKESNEGTQSAAVDDLGDAQVQAELVADQRAKQKQKNCETANKNMSILNKGEVYEPDAKGNMIRLTPEQIASKRSNVQKDIDYFCSE